MAIDNNGFALPGRGSTSVALTPRRASFASVVVYGLRPKLALLALVIRVAVGGGGCSGPTAVSAPHGSGSSALVPHASAASVAAVISARRRGRGAVVFPVGRGWTRVVVAGVQRVIAVASSASHEIPSSASTGIAAARGGDTGAFIA